ncbi:MAG: YigZ family protein, partial [Bacteroidota bacterium]
YKTILESFESEVLKIKKSKFIGFAIPVSNENNVKDALNKIRILHPSASHWCYAYKIGTNVAKVKANDDGEPMNSAGKPILGQIQSFDVTNIIIIIVRYYGGTKLGVGGLITAYKETAKNVLITSTIVEKELTKTLLLNFKYDLLNSVMRVTKQYQLSFIEQTMELDCRIKLEVPKKIFEEVIDKYASIYGIKITEL